MIMLLKNDLLPRAILLVVFSIVIFLCFYKKSNVRMNAN